MTAGDPFGLLSESEGALLFRSQTVATSAPKFVIVRDINWSQTNYQANSQPQFLQNLAYIPYMFNIQTVFANVPNQPFAVYKITPDLTPQQIASGNIPAANMLNITSDMSYQQVAQTFIDALSRTNSMKASMQTALNQNQLLSYSGQLLFDLNNNNYKVDTLKAVAVAGSLNNNLMDFNQASVTADVYQGTFFASSLDSQSLSLSNRILAVYTTDVRGTGDNSVVQSDGSVHYYPGTLPTLAEQGNAVFHIKTARKADGYQAYALSMDGTRLAQIPVTESADGTGVDVNLTTDKGYAFEIVYDPLLEDNFELSPDTNWTVLNGTWQIADDGTGNHAYYQSDSVSGVTEKAKAGQSSWTDYRVSADVKDNSSGSGSYFGLMARYVDTSDFYLMTYCNATRNVTIYRNQSGLWTTLNQVTLPSALDMSVYHRFSLEAAGSSLNAYVDGQLKLSVSDSTFTSGYAGLLTSLDPTYFDNVVVAPVDATPPTAPGNLNGFDLNGTQTQISWTSSTDNMNVAGYQIYRDGSLISSVTPDVTTYADSGLAMNTSYTYTVTAFDPSGNVSASSNALTLTTSDTLLQDDFEHGSINNWTVSNGTWQIVDDGSGTGNHAYYQSNTTSGATYKSIAGQSSWTDYSVRADVRDNSTGSSSYFGLMARYVDSSDFYMMTYDNSTRNLTIYLVQGGKWTSLGHVVLSAQLDMSTYHNFQFSLSGSTLSGFVDGQNVLTVTDGTFSNGSIGLLTNVDQTYFDNVMVQ